MTGPLPGREGGDQGQYSPPPPPGVRAVDISLQAIRARVVSKMADMGGNALKIPSPKVETKITNSRTDQSIL